MAATIVVHAFGIAAPDVRGDETKMGPAIGADKKSVALSVTLQPLQATMTDAEIDAVAAKIVANVEKQTGGVLRG